MAWCRQATSHYISQCWPRCMLLALLCHTELMCLPIVIVPCLYCFTINTLRPRQNGCLFADDTFKRIFLKENIRILIKTSLKFVPKGLINNIPALVLIMAPTRRQAIIYLNQWWLDHWCLYASLGLNELMIYHECHQYVWNISKYFDTTADSSQTVLAYDRCWCWRLWDLWWRHQMETFSALQAFCVGGEFTLHRWIPRTKAIDAELWCFLWSAH